MLQRFPCGLCYPAVTGTHAPHRVRDLRQAGGEQARVHVEGDGRGRMPQLPLQCLDVRARGDGHARVRVAQAVDRDAFAGEPAGAECRVPRPRPPVSRSSLSSPSYIRRG